MLEKEKNNLTWLNLISFDGIWSVFGFRGKTAEDRKKDAKPKPEREIFKWIDPVGKTVTLPPDLISAFKKNRSQAEVFNNLPFSHKKEYLEWIVTAKKTQTRNDRIDKTISLLKKGWRNPTNR
jgi:hypothetical protein